MNLAWVFCVCVHALRSGGDHFNFKKIKKLWGTDQSRLPLPSLDTVQLSRIATRISFYFSQYCSSLVYRKINGNKATGDVWIGQSAHLHGDWWCTSLIRLRFSTDCCFVESETSAILRQSHVKVELKL